MYSKNVSVQCKGVLRKQQFKCDAKGQEQGDKFWHPKVQMVPYSIKYSVSIWS